MPNLPVDVNSWGRSACYPRSTFYPLSDGPSTRNHRITSTCFRTCATCKSCSQAPLCAYTLRPVSIRPEGTFVRLRYSLGGDRPSQTAHQTLSPDRITICRLGFQVDEGWYFKVDSPYAGTHGSTSPTYPTHLTRNPMPSYSKGSRGLFVLLRVVRICTHTPISLGLQLRQWGNRYAIRAGRNLPD